MYAIIVIRYRLPLEEVQKVTDEHRAYLRSLKAAGTLIASGPMDPRSGGMLLLRVPDGDVQQSLTEIRNGDPFFQKNVGNYELLPWKLEKKSWTNCRSARQSLRPAKLSNARA
jgi:uncharacterized protein YciI